MFWRKIKFSWFSLAYSYFSIFFNISTVFFPYRFSCFSIFFHIFTIFFSRKKYGKNTKKYGNNMEKIWRQKAPLSGGGSLSASSPALAISCPSPHPALNAAASMTTQVKRVSCTAAMYVTTVCDSVTLCFPPVRTQCLGYTLSLYAICSSNRRNELLYTQLQMQVVKSPNGHKI